MPLDVAAAALHKRRIPQPISATAIFSTATIIIILWLWGGRGLVGSTAEPTVRSLDVSAIMCTFSKTAAGGKWEGEACRHSETGTSCASESKRNGGKNMVCESILHTNLNQFEGYQTTYESQFYQLLQRLAGICTTEGGERTREDWDTLTWCVFQL